MAEDPILQMEENARRIERAAEAETDAALAKHVGGKLPELGYRIINPDRAPGEKPIFEAIDPEFQAFASDFLWKLSLPYKYLQEKAKTTAS